MVTSNQPQIAGERPSPRTSPAAILDRLLHHYDVVAINGPSYRLKNRLQALARETEAA
ncbi:ATP-binding protein [Streptomyces sp. NPDC018693]|uniref:ATP-binding protein n=1 Tax=unclassified Streptomyces TaxID=2593676 RepID=UPI00379AEE24